MTIMFGLSTILLLLLLLAGVGIAIFTLKGNSKDKTTTKKCPDCKKEVDLKEKICPNCGYPFSKSTAKDKKTQKNILIKKIILWIYQITCGISIVLVFEWLDNFIDQLLMLLALLLNTITLIIFNIKLIKNGKKLSEKISVISLIAILCGLAFSINYTIVLINHSSVGYDNDLREIMYLETYTKEEARIFLDNMYYALRENEYYTDNVELYGIWEDREKENEYYVNFEVLSGGYLPANSMKVVVSPHDKTKVERIYWQFNDEVEIEFYKDGKQVEDFTYVYNCAVMGDEPSYPIKDYIEEDIKENLKSPSSAIFTYNEQKYSPSEKRFKIYGWVEAQNSFGAMVKEDFIITLIPCKEDYCEWYGVSYTWRFS